MLNRKFFIPGLLLAIIGAGALIGTAACEHAAVDNLSAGQGAAVGAGVPELAPVPRTLGVLLNLGGGGGERTVRPLLTASAFEKIIVKLYEGGVPVEEKTVEQTAITDTAIPVRFNLRGAGDYILEVEGYRAGDDYPLVRGRGTAAVTEAGFSDGVTMTVDLGLSDEARTTGETGGISLELSWGDPMVVLDAALYQLDMTTAAAPALTELESPQAISFLDIPPGNYFLTLLFKRDGDRTVGYFIEAVTVYPGLVSDRWYGLDGTAVSVRTISPEEMRSSETEIASLQLMRIDESVSTVALSTNSEKAYWPTTVITAGANFRLAVTCHPGQAISPLTKTVGASAQMIPVTAAETANVWTYDFSGGPGTGLYFTVHAADGSDQKIYSVLFKRPVAKLEIEGGGTLSYMTVRDAFAALPAGATGAVTLLQDISAADGFGVDAAIVVSDNKTVTLASLSGAARQIKSWQNGRNFPFFRVEAGAHLTLRGWGTTLTLTLDGGAAESSPLTSQEPLIVVTGTGARLTMENFVFLKNNQLDATSSGQGGAVFVDSGAVFTMNGGTIQNSTGPNGDAVHVAANAFIDLRGNATSDNVIYLASAGTAWASVSVTGAITGGAPLWPQKTEAGTTLVRGADGYTLTEANLNRFELLSPGNATLVYDGSGLGTGRLARTWYIKNDGNDSYAGTAAAPFRMPKKALDQVLPGGTAELVFIGMVTASGSPMLGERVGNYANIPVWMNVDGQKKITLSGSGTGAGFDGLPRGSSGRTALWINDNAHVTLKNGMEIIGGSWSEIAEQPHTLFSLVTVRDGTLAIEDSAHVLTEVGDWQDGKSIGVPPGQGFVQVDGALGYANQMHIRILFVDGSAYATSVASSMGHQILMGSAVATQYTQFSTWGCPGYNFSADGFIVYP